MRRPPPTPTPTPTPTPSGRTAFDYDGDRKTDFSVYRPSNGIWYLQRTTAGFFGINFGNSTDRIVPADYDGDGKTDVAVYRPSEGIWYIVNSSNGANLSFRFGLSQDIPAPADYDGDVIQTIVKIAEARRASIQKMQYQGNPPK